VLLQVKTRPFLSHKREDAPDVATLREILGIYGTGGWKDTEDLRLGDLTEGGIRRAIMEQTGGFIWWGTPAILTSSIVNRLEIPAALERKRSEPLYPVVPLFVGLNPGAASDRSSIAAALADQGEAFLSCNGLEKSGDESILDFNRRVSQRYLRDVLKSVAEGTPLLEVVSIAFRIQSGPDGNHDLTFDWRNIFDLRTRYFVGEGRDLVDSALATARDALQTIMQTPHVELDMDLPLPLAFLVGYEWRITSRMRLSVRQRTRITYSVIESDGVVVQAPIPTRESLRGTGPAVIAVSCGRDIGDQPQRYAAEVNARELISLHVPGELSPGQIRGLSRACASELGNLNNRSVEKHLLMLGPAALAMFAGAASNACGSVVVPFWDGRRYCNSLVVGDDERTSHARIPQGITSEER
jgi:hypothetical protein